MNVIVDVPLLTAEEFAELPDSGLPRELVRGRIETMNVPYPRHGQICCKTARLLGNFGEEQQLGQAVTNDSGVVIERGPDTVRGADVAFYSYARLPPGPLPEGYLQVLPDAVFEVRSHFDRWPRILAKVAEYLNAGVPVVCVVDQQTESVYVYQADEAVRIFTSEQVLELPGLLNGWRVPVRALFA